MSKSKRKSKAADIIPGFVRGRFAEVATLADSTKLGAGPPEFPKAVKQAVVALTKDTITTVFPVMPQLHTLSTDGMEMLCGLLHYAATQGFAMALYRYADELKRVPELAAWQRKRIEGVNKGHATQSQARAAKYQRIRETQAQLEAAGEPCTYDAVAAACGCSRSTVERAINDRPTKRTKR